METRNFEEDLQNSNNPILKQNWEKIIKKKFGNDCIISWKDDLNIQKGLGTDIIIKTKKGRRYSIELKTRNHRTYKNPEYIMEIVHHIYDKETEPRLHIGTKDGWVYMTTAEFIFHATLNEEGTDIIECLFYSLHPFKNPEFKSFFNKFPVMWLTTNFSNGTFQLTLNKLIPIKEIRENALSFWYWSKENEL